MEKSSIALFRRNELDWTIDDESDEIGNWITFTRFLVGIIAWMAEEGNLEIYELMKAKIAEQDELRFYSNYRKNTKLPQNLFSFAQMLLLLHVGGFR